MSEENKAALIERNRSRVYTEEEKAKRRETALKLGIKPPSRKGAKLTEEQIERCKQRRKGKPPKEGS